MSSNIVAIVRDPSPTLAACELTFLEREPIDFPRAQSQHAAYKEHLVRSGARLEVLPADSRYPDSVFVEDTAVVLEEVAILPILGAPSRQGETTLIRETLARYRKLAPLEGDARLDGGDVLRVGKRLFVGISKRTNQESVRQMQQILAPHGYEVVPVSMRDVLHLKTAVSRVGDDTLLFNPEWLDAATFVGLRLIAIFPEERFAANTLRVNERVTIGECFPRTRAILEQAGFATDVLDVSELMKAEAGLTCMSILLEDRLK